MDFEEGGAVLSYTFEKHVNPAAVNYHRLVNDEM